MATKKPDLVVGYKAAAEVTGLKVNYLHQLQHRGLLPAGLGPRVWERETLEQWKAARDGLQTKTPGTK